MKKRIKKLRQTIDIKEVLLRSMILLVTIVLVYYSDTTSRQVLNIFGFLIAFFYLYKIKHFFPLMTATLFMYLVASLQEFWDITYVHSVVTETYWKLGNGLLIVSVLRFTYTIIYNYKIVKNED